MNHNCYAFAGVRGSHCASWSMCGTAAAVRQELGALHAYEGEDWRQGWTRAKREGYRVQRVQIRYRSVGK